MEIHFHNEEVDFPDLDISIAESWFSKIAEAENHELGELNFIFCSDEHLLNINRQYLDHDFYTDIITFDYAEEQVSGDIYISLDRVKENASTFGESYERELRRVMAHGLLHLMGYKDKSDEEAKEMREKEEAALSLL